MSRKFIGLLAVVLILAFVGTASAKDYVWDGGGGDGRWGTQANWNPDGYPGKSGGGKDWCVIDTTGALVTVDYNARNCYGILVNNGTLHIADTANPDCPSGPTCATYNYVGSKAMAIVGRFAGDDGRIIVGQNSAYTVNYNRWVGLKHFHIGNEGLATGTVDCSGTVWMGTTVSTYIGKGNLEDGQGTGTLNLYDGAEFNTDYMGIGFGGIGTVNVSGGLLNSKRGGNLGFDVGRGDGTGALNVTGGEVYLRGRLNLTQGENATGHVQLDGGVINADDIYEWDGEGTMDITGGELIVRWNNPANTGTRKGRVQQYINQGKITSCGGGGIFTLQNKWHDRYDDEGNYIGSDIDCHVKAICPITGVGIEIYPDDDPTLLTVNTQGKGRIPINILGSETFDVTQVELTSLNIAGTVLPAKAPSAGDDHNGDGIADIRVLFSRRDVILALGLDEMDPGEVVSITVSGTMVQQQFEYPTGVPFSGSDDVILEARGD
ncbi:MAG: hypothetical protein ACYTBZ_05865 [Planctomycetota bacterium]|jgi:hypothetical protein